MSPSSYSALGIDLPRWANLNASIRCFANPAAHNRDDRTPSCSVHLTSGASKCHGCGAKGGAYDAAIHRGHTPASAMDLLVACGLAERDQPPYRRNRSAPAATPSVADKPTDRASVHRTLEATDADISSWAQQLDHDSPLIRRLNLERAWGQQAIKELDVGYDGERITIPIRNRHGQLRGVLRYDPFGKRTPKMLAIRGTRLGLIPHPDRDRREHVVLVEGPPDLIAARSAGLAAIAVPGTAAWRAEWALLLRHRHVTVVMDCDPPGRNAAAQVAHDLALVAASITIADLDPRRQDGYDLSDHIRARRRSTNHRVGLRPIGWPIASLLGHLTVMPQSPSVHRRERGLRR